MPFRFASLLLAGLAFLNPASAAPSVIEEGRAVYNFRCYFCHGYSGNGQTLAATYLNPKPTNFQQAEPEKFTSAHVMAVLQAGKPGTAMKPFTGIISDREMKAVAEFVVDEFVRRKAENTRYHTPENGWPNHERYKDAFPFAKGEIPLSRPWESLSERESEEIGRAHV
jgi:cytochrome c oxidase cbb3-type subunit 3